MALTLRRPDDGLVPDEDGTRKKLFMAGPIQGSGNWDERLADALSDVDAVAYDPRRKTMSGFVYEEQVSWETGFLAAAGIVSFTFWPEEQVVPGRSYAQTSRFELGEALARSRFAENGQKVVVYCPEGFAGRSYFEYKVRCEYSDVAEIFSEWEPYVSELERLLSPSGR